MKTFILYNINIVWNEQFYQLYFNYNEYNISQMDEIESANNWNYVDC